MSHVLDLTGQRFGRLTAVRRTDKKDSWGRCWLWECHCDCGKTCYVSSTFLVHGVARSCGCLQENSRKINVAGQRFGSLTAIKPTDKIKDHSVVWVWRCDCGRTAEFTLDSVMYGGRKSCGCKNRAVKQQQALAMQKNCGRQDGTMICALRSTKIASNNTSGFRGVSWHRGLRKYQARIDFCGQRYHLGYYDTAEAASAAYQEAKKRLHGGYLEQISARQEELREETGEDPAQKCPGKTSLGRDQGRDERKSTNA